MQTSTRSGPFFLYVSLSRFSPCLSRSRLALECKGLSGSYTAMASPSASWRKRHCPCLTRLGTAVVAIIICDIYVSISTSHCADPVFSSVALPVRPELFQNNVVLILFPSQYFLPTSCVHSAGICLLRLMLMLFFVCPNLSLSSHPCRLSPGLTFHLNVAYCPCSSCPATLERHCLSSCDSHPLISADLAQIPFRR